MVDVDVVAVEAARHRGPERNRLDRLTMPRIPECGVGLTAAICGVGEDLQAGFLTREKRDSGRSVRSVRGRDPRPR